MVLVATATNRDAVRAFLEKELSLSYKRVKEVGGYQKGVLTLFFSFFTVLLTAVVLLDPLKIKGIRAQMEPYLVLLPALAFFIGLALFILYFNYELYIRRYKAHTKNIEEAFHAILSADSADLAPFKLTYYAAIPGHPERLCPEIVFDGTLIVPLLITLAMNVALFLLLSNVLGLGRTYIWWTVGIGAAVNVLIPVLLYRRELRSKTNKRPTAPLPQPASQTKTRSREPAA